MPVAALDLCFKGDRAYLTGADIYEAALRAVSGAGRDAGRVRCSFHTIATTALEIRFGPRAAMGERPPDCAAEIHLGDGENAVTGWISETGTPIDCRQPYDEDSIARSCNVVNDSIRVRQPTGFRPIEVAIAMTKRLHYSRRPAASGRWIFTRLDIARPLQETDVAGMEVVLKGELGVQLTRSELRAGGQKLGSIFFSLVQM